MLNPKALVALACAGWLAACGSSDAPAAPDIAKVEDLKSSFGPEYQVESFSSGIDPSVLAQQSLPPGLVFNPATCEEFATASALPADLKGNMAAVFAEGAGNRFVTIALETSEPVPVNQPSDECTKVGFAGGALRGAVEVVESPQIDGVSTLGTLRIYQTTIDGVLSHGELYNYVASFDNFQVIVTANALVEQGHEVKEVDTAKARELLADAVAAIRG